MSAQPRKKKPKAEPEFPCVIETFRRPGAWERNSLTHEHPSCFNGVVTIRRYRITFEETEEPKEVLIERVRKLWRECDNTHHYSPLQAVARSLGVELDIAELGKNRKDRK